MRLKKLGNTDFRITPLGFGTWALGGGSGGYGWGPQDDADSIAAIVQGVEKGINWVDTAAIYGLGHSEQVVAKALKKLGRSRRPYVFTKCGLIWDAKGNSSHSLKRASILRECDNSLRRLEIEVIDLYQIHWPAFPPGAPAPEIEEGWQALLDLQAQGKIRYPGISNFNVPQMERIRPLGAISSLQPPYSLLMPEIESDILPYCTRHNIGVIVYSPMHSGLLSGAFSHERLVRMAPNDWRRNSPAFKEPAFSQAMELVEVLRRIGQRHGRSAGEVAIAWTLRDPAVTGAIVGGRTPQQVDGFIGALDFRLSKEELAEIEAAQPAPVPLL
ncbi:MAG: aldo/keto reductase [Terriglobales bacterium]